MTIDLSAIAKWPNVPACYNWLSLDRRGHWRLQGERLTHRGLIDFINRQYACDESGNWFVQNGPQRVFVQLDYTPWIFHLSAGEVICHTGNQAGQVERCFIDEEGNVILKTNSGIGLLDDRDLTFFIDQCLSEHNATVDEENWAKIISGETTTKITWCDLLLSPIRKNQVAELFNFQASPQP